MTLDLLPAHTQETLNKRLLEAGEEQGSKRIETVLRQWFPQCTAAMLVELAEVPPSKKMHLCSKTERTRIVQLIKHLELHLTRPRPIEEAIVTGGGAALAEIDSKKMESKRLQGLFFAGEVLDLAGPSGGYNLQAAFSTGYLAGQSVGARY